MSQLTQLLEELTAGSTERNARRAFRRTALRQRNRPVRQVGRELEELEPRDVPTLLGQQLFPSDNPWNQNVASAPVSANSAAIIAHIGASVSVHPDWGTDSSSNGNDPLYGIPVNVVHGNSVAKVNVIIGNYAGESDIEPVPIPANAVIEGDYQDGPNPNGPGYGSGQRGDSHLIIWDEDNNIAYELFEAARPTDPGSDGQWHAAQESVWNMNADSFRSIGYTSADAAGLSILAGLVRPDEALPTSQGGQGAIDHALRFTLPSGDINPQYVFPASHEISVSSQSDTSLPMGARLRLANTPAIDALIASMGPEAQAIATAMQQYGLILADDGSPMFVTGTSASVNASNQIDLTWNMDDVLGLRSLTASDFQVLNLAPIVTGIGSSTGDAGNTIAITGQNFSGAAGHLQVFFGASAATSVAIVSDTEVTAVVPAGTGTVNVTVQSGIYDPDDVSDNPDANVNAPIFGYGTSADSSADLFTYVAQTVSAANSSDSFASSTDTSGSPDLVTFRIEDTNGNAVSGLPSSAFAPSLSGGSSAGTFGSASETSIPGTYTASFTGTAAGTASALTVAVTGVQLDEQPTVQVGPGSPSGSTSTVDFASAADASATADAIAIVVEDAAGNPISGLASSAFAFSLAGGTSTGTAGAVTATDTPGTYTANFVGATAGSATALSLKINGLTLLEHPRVTVVPGTVSGSKSTLKIASATDKAGTPDAVTISLEDAAGNAIAGLPGSAFSFTAMGGTSTGTFGNAAGANVPGTYTAAFIGARSGTASSLILSVDGVPIATEPKVTVEVGAASAANSTVSLATPTVASGASDRVTIEVEDAGGNPIPGFSSSAFVIGLASGGSTGSFSAVSPTDVPGVYAATFTASLAGTAEPLALKVNGLVIAAHPEVQVVAGAVNGTRSKIGVGSASVASSSSDEITIEARDAAGNPISGLSSSAFALNFAGGKSTGTIGTVSATTMPGTYTAFLTGVIAGTASSLSVRIAGVPIASPPKVIVKAGPVSATNSTVRFASPTVAVGHSEAATITVEDAVGNPITGLANAAFELQLLGGTSRGSFGSVLPTATPGTYIVTYKGIVAGTANSLSLAVDGIPLASDPTIQVV